MSEEKNPIRVFIADDHALLRKGLRDIIEADESLTVCGEAGAGKEALQKIQELNPDVTVLDIDMPELSGLDVAGEIRRRGLKTSFVALTMHDQESIFNRAMDLGILGYVLKDGAVTDIVDAVKAAFRERHYISPALSTLTISRGNKGPAVDPSIVSAGLTQTEMKVLRLIAQGKTTKEIAETLFVSPRTIESHRTNITGKLNLHGTNALLRFALENKHKL